MGIKKVNTTAYHPQTDGLVENFNKTLRAMTAKHAKKFGSQWDVYLHHLLFAYRTKPHESTGESPFYLLYGRDARLPTEGLLDTPPGPYMVDCEDYQVEVGAGCLLHGKLPGVRLKMHKRSRRSSMTGGQGRKSIGLVDG